MKYLAEPLHFTCFFTSKPIKKTKFVPSNIRSCARKMISSYLSRHLGQLNVSFVKYRAEFASKCDISACSTNKSRLARNAI